MGRFFINGKWYDAARYKDASEMASKLDPPPPAPPLKPPAVPKVVTAPVSVPKISQPVLVPPPTPVTSVAVPVAPVVPGITLYRADARSPGLLKHFEGYKPWYALTIEQVKLLIEFVAGVKTWDDVRDKLELSLQDFPPPTLDQGFGKQKVTKCDPITFHEWIIRSKDRGPSVSFAQTEEGTFPYGADPTTHIYRVAFPLKEVAWGIAVPGSKVRGPMQPKLCMDGDTLADTNTKRIAIKGVFGNCEVSCLYAVTPGEIFTYKDTTKSLVEAKLLSDASISVIEPKLK